MFKWKKDRHQKDDPYIFMRCRKAFVFSLPMGKIEVPQPFNFRASPLLVQGKTSETNARLTR